MQKEKMDSKTMKMLLRAIGLRISSDRCGTLHLHCLDNGHVMMLNVMNCTYIGWPNVELLWRHLKLGMEFVDRDDGMKTTENVYCGCKSIEEALVRMDLMCI